MKFCKKCGNNISGNQKFCSRCGANLNYNDTKEDNLTGLLDIIEVNENQQEITSNGEIDGSLNRGEKDINIKTIQTTSSNNTKIDKRVIIAIAAIVAVVILGFGIKATLSSLYSPKRTVKKFVQAVESDNNHKLKSLLYSSNPAIEITDEAVDALIKAFKEQVYLFTDASAMLNNDIFQSYKLVTEGSSVLLDSNELFALTIKNDNFLFTKYAIMVKPIAINVSSNVPNSKVFINEEEVGLAKEGNQSNLIGCYIPGIYKVTLKAKDLFNNEIIDTKEILAIDNNTGCTTNFFEDYNNVYISSNVPDAKILINGKATNISIKESNNGFGPITSKDILTASYMLNGKEYISTEASTVNSRTSIDLSFSYNDYYEIDKILSSQKESEIAENQAREYIEKYKDRDFIIPSSNTVALGFKELNNYNLEEIFIAQNEMLARNGYVFSSYPVLQKYFESKSWYKANTSFNGELSNQIEKDNYSMLRTVNFSIIAREKSEKITADFIFNDSNKREISSYQINNLSDWQLIIARNEIFARYGLEFSTKDIMEHFKEKSWFKINSELDNNLALNEIERKNVESLLEVEKVRIKNVLNYDLGEEY